MCTKNNNSTSYRGVVADSSPERDVGHLVPALRAPGEALYQQAHDEVHSHQARESRTNQSIPDALLFLNEACFMFKQRIFGARARCEYNNKTRSQNLWLIHL